MENTDFKSNHIEETIHQMGTPSELEEIEYDNSLATWKYKKCVNKINVDDYKNEKEMLENDPLSMLKC